MTKKFSLLVSVSLLLAASSLNAQSALRAGFVDGADVFFFFDPQGVNTSAFSQAVQANQSPEVKAAAEEQKAKFTEATGLEEEDLTAIVFSMSLDGIDFESQDPAQLETAKAVLAAELKKSVTLEQVKQALLTMGESSKGPVPDLNITEVDGMQVLELVGTQTEGGMDKAYSTLSEDGKTVLLSFNTASLKEGLNRLASGAPAAPSAEMENAVKTLGDRQIRMALVLPAAARAKIQQGVQAGAAQGGMGAMFMPFAGMTSLLIGVQTAENLDLTLSLDLGNPGNAQQAAGMMQSMLPMMMMGMQQQLGPEAMGLANKIKIAPNGNAVSLNISLTPDDVNMLPASMSNPMMNLP